MILHEMYFANLGGDGEGVGPAAEKALVQAYGSRPRWEELFRALRERAGRGSGWAILDWDLHAQAARTYWAGGPHQCAGLRRSAPGDGHVRARVCDGLRGLGQGYIDAFFKNINWPRSTAASGMGTRPVVLICRHDPAGRTVAKCWFDYAGSMAHGHQPRCRGSGILRPGPRQGDFLEKRGRQAVRRHHRHHLLTASGSSSTEALASRMR